MDSAFRAGYRRSLQTAALMLCGAAAAAGIVCAYLASTRASLPLGVTAVVLLLAAPPVAVVGLLARNSTPWPPDLIRVDRLIDGMHHADSTLRMIRMTRAHVGVAAASAFLAWACEGLELTDFRTFALCLTVLVAIAAAGYLPWLARQEQLVQQQRMVLRRQLDAISTAEKWFAG
jgi:hypothetical protein